MNANIQKGRREIFTILYHTLYDIWTAFHPHLRCRTAQTVTISNVRLFLKSSVCRIL